MAKAKVLLVGESWMSSATHYKGFDQFGSVTFHLGATPLVTALKDSEFDLEYMPAHEAVEKLPFTMEGLAQYKAIILSDIGANSLLLHPDVWLHGKTVPNRLKLLRDWTLAGGGLIMIGGYFSFQGIDGKARWHRTAVEDALPVTCLPNDDRLEIPEGFRPEIIGPRITRSLPASTVNGPFFSAPMRSLPASGTMSKSWPGCRRTRAVTPCWSRDAMARVAPWSGRQISARTGCRTVLSNGPAMRAFGPTCCAG